MYDNNKNVSVVHVSGVIQVNGTRYITQKKYAEIMGINPSTVSLKKESLPFEYIEDLGKQLINFDRLEFDEEKRQAAEQTIASRESLFNYTLPQLGDFLQILILRANKEVATANQLRDEAERQRETSIEELRLANLKLNGQEEQLGLSNVEIGELKNRLSKLDSDFSAYKLNVEVEKTDDKVKIEELTSENKGLKIALGIINNKKADVPFVEKGKQKRKKSVKTDN